MHPVRAESPSPREAQLAQRLVGLGLITGDQLRAVWALRSQGDPRPLEQVLVQERMLSPEALQRVLASTPAERRHETLELPGVAAPTTPPPSGWGAAAAAPVPPQVRHTPRPASDPGASARLASSARVARPPTTGTGSDPLAGSISSSLRVQPGSVVQLTPELHVRCERLLGQGGMGTVHLVHDPTLGRRAALKLVKGEGSETRARRFRREVVVTARLDHPGIPPVYLSGRTPAGQDFLLMRFVDGQAMDQLLDQVHGRVEGGTPTLRAPEPRDLLDALVKVSEALAYAHSRGIVHRDLKPANIMIGAFGEVLLMDWGLARDLAESSQEDVAVRAELAASALSGTKGLTQDGALLGTPGYLPPEQARGEDVDARADVYALGAVLVEVLTGEPPVTGATTLEVLAKTGQGEVTLPRQRNPEVAPELDAIAAKALARAPGRRYQSAAEFGADLKAYLEGRPVSVYRYGAVEQLRRLARKHPAALVGLTVAFLLTLVGVVAVAQARAGAAAAERAAAVARARAAFEDARAAFEEGRGVDVDRTIGLALSALQAAQRWRVLAPDDDDAARAQHAAAVALGELAERAEQWSLAVEAFRQAGGLGVDDAGAEAAVARVEAARNAEAERRREEVARLLEAARKGDLSRRADGLQDAVFKIARYTDAATVALLRERLDQVSRRLEDAQRKIYAELAEPDADEARLGERPIVGLSAAVEARLQTGLRAELAPAHAERLAEAARRLERRAARERVASDSARPHAPVLLGARQAAEVGAGELEVARLACEALGRIGDPIAIPALVRYLLAECDALRAIPAGVALVRIGGPEAQQLIMGARVHFGRNSAFTFRIDDVLSSTDGGAAPPIEEETAEEYFRRGEWFAARKKHAEAERDFARAIELAPNDAEAYSRRGNVRLDLGRPEAALEDYDRAVALDPDEPRFLANRSTARSRLGDLQGALADLDRALELDPDNGSMYVNRGIIHFDLGNHVQALKDYDLAIEREPDVIHGWLNRGLARSDLGDREGALSDLDRAISIDPREPRAWLGRAIVRRALGQLDMAQADLDQAIALDPSIAVCWEVRGVVRRERGDLEGALADLTRATELAPRAPSPWVRRAEARRKLRDLHGALADVERALELDPGSQTARKLRAELLLDVDPVRAGQEAEALLAAGVVDARALIARGRARAASGDPIGAVADLQRACELAPDDPRAWMELGACRYTAGDMRGALEAYDRALSLEPSYAEALSDRAMVKRALGDREGAFADCRAAIAAAPENPKHRINLATLLGDAGEYDQARAELDAAISAAPSLWEGWFRRGLLRMRTGDPTGAIDDLGRAIEADPERPEPWEVRGLLRSDAGETAAGAADAERALRLDPNRPVCLFVQAKHALRVGNARQAAELTTRALRMRGAPPNTLALRATAREQLGDVPGAIEDLEAYLAAGPPDPERRLAEEMLARLRKR